MTKWTPCVQHCSVGQQWNVEWRWQQQPRQHRDTEQNDNQWQRQQQLFVESDAASDVIIILDFFSKTIKMPLRMNHQPNDAQQQTNASEKKDYQKMYPLPDSYVSFFLSTLSIVGCQAHQINALWIALHSIDAIRGIKDTSTRAIGNIQKFSLVRIVIQ